MDKKYISNPVFDGLQVPTLEEGPRAKSTILYANRYSGISEVELTDPELKSVIEGTVGTSGNNVLVQLKNKMATFRNGPWYIDSENGVIHIHNRKHPESSVYQYIYQYENGEVLTASFRMVEVSSPIAGLGGFVSAVTKAVGMLQAEIGKQNLEAPNQLPTKDDLYSQFGGKYEAKPFSTYVSTNRSVWEQQLDAQYERDKKSKADQAETEKEWKNYNAKSPKEKMARSAKKYNYNYDIIKPQTKMDLFTNPKKGGNSMIKPAFQTYKEQADIFGKNSTYAKRAKEDLINEARKTNINVPSGDYWTTWKVQLTTQEILVSSQGPYGKQPPSQGAIQAAIQRRIQQYISSYKKKKIINVKRVGDYILRDLGSKRISSTFGFKYYEKYNVTFWISYFGYGSGTRKMSAERFIRGILDRYDGSSSGRGGGVPNVSNMIRNATANIGRGKKEKRLQASLTVIGNPILETGQQIGIQNVGKKYSGNWYIHKITHSLDPGRGYTTDLVLSRQAPKPPVSGTYSEIHTQSYTVDGEQADPKKIRRSGRGTTSNRIRGKANVAKGNREYTYQDALNELWTLDERIYMEQIAHDPKAATEAVYRIADTKYMNHVHGRHDVAVLRHDPKKADGKYKFTLQPNLYTRDQVPRKAGTSSQFDVVRNKANRRRK